MKKVYYVQRAYTTTRTGNIIPEGWDLMCNENWCQRFWYKRDAKVAMEEAIKEELALAGVQIIKSVV